MPAPGAQPRLRSYETIGRVASGPLALPANVPAKLLAVALGPILNVRLVPIETQLAQRAGVAAAAPVGEAAAIADAGAVLEPRGAILSRVSRAGRIPESFAVAEAPP